MKGYKTAVHAARSKVGLKELDRSCEIIDEERGNYFYLMKSLDQFENEWALSDHEKIVVKNHFNNLYQLHDTMTQALQRGEP